MSREVEVFEFQKYECFLDIQQKINDFLKRRKLNPVSISMVESSGRIIVAVIVEV